MITAGVDIGSTTSKAVLLNGDNILGQIVIINKRQTDIKNTGT